MSELKKCECGHESATPQRCADCNMEMCEECYEQHFSAQAIDKHDEPLAVQLIEAWAWFCKSCGHLNTIQVVREDLKDVDLDEESANAIKKELGLDPWQDIPEDLVDTLVSIPNDVQCQHCGLNFQTVPPEGSISSSNDEDDDTDNLDVLE